MIYRILYNIRNFPREIKWFFQRGIRGYSDSDLWSLDDYLSKWLPKALKQFNERRLGHPYALNDKKWDKILKDIIKGFEAHHRYTNFEYGDVSVNKLDKLMEKDRDTFNKGLDLFREHYSNLWD